MLVALRLRHCWLVDGWSISSIAWFHCMVAVAGINIRIRSNVPVVVIVRGCVRVWLFDLCCAGSLPRPKFRAKSRRAFYGSCGMSCRRKAARGRIWKFKMGSLRVGSRCPIPSILSHSGRAMDGRSRAKFSMRARIFMPVFSQLRLWSCEHHACRWLHRIWTSSTEHANISIFHIFLHTTFHPTAWTLLQLACKDLNQ